MNQIDIMSPREESYGLEEDLQAALAAFDVDGAELSVRLTDDDEIAVLNQQYRQIDKPTDVLSFPQMETPLQTSDGLPHLHLGDIVISVETAARQAELQKHALAAEIRILARHGLLHLLGYDHDGSEPEAWDCAAEILERSEL